MKISFSEAAANCDKAEKALEKLQTQKNTEIAKINNKFNPDIFTAEQDFKKAKAVIAKMVAAPKAPVKKPVHRINQEA